MILNFVSIHFFSIICFVSLSKPNTQSVEKKTNKLLSVFGMQHTYINPVSIVRFSRGGGHHQELASQLKITQTTCANIPWLNGGPNGSSKRQSISEFNNYIATLLQHYLYQLLRLSPTYCKSQRYF